MTRKIVAAILVIGCSSLALPMPVAAGEAAPATVRPRVLLSQPITKAIAVLAKAEAPRLQAQPQAPAPQSESGGGLSSRAKIGIGAAVVVASVATAIAIAKGPEARRWP